jgi:hypothetical protein
VIAGEAKRGPELWDCIDQLRAIADALPSAGPSGGGCLFILAVGLGWQEDALEVGRLVATGRTTVSIWVGGQRPENPAAKRLTLERA